MTYKELVDSIKNVVEGHLILRDFGYGALTDIKTVDEGTRVNYPYAFLNPTQSTRTGQTITYRFNLIVMDVVQEDPTNGFSNYLKVQSDCQQYVDDILAQLRFGEPLNDFDLTLNVNLTPFKERFQDTVAGMTATLEIEIPYALNLCLAPVLQQYFLEYSFTPNQIKEPDPVGSTIGTQQPTYDPLGLWYPGTDPDRYYTAVYFTEPNTGYYITVTGTARALESKPIPPAPIASTTITTVEVPPTTGSTQNYTPLIDGQNTWPEGQTTTNQFEWKANYEVNSGNISGNQQTALVWSLRGDGDPADESQMEFIVTDIKIRKQRI